MPDLKLLTSELEQTRSRYRELEIEHGAKPTADARSEMAGLHDRAMKLQQLIEDEQDSQRRADMERLNAWADAPVYKVPVAVQDDKSGRKAIEAAGWEVRAGQVYAPTSNGQYPIYSEEVLFGPIPKEDDDAATYFRQARSIIQPEYRAAYEKWLRASVKFRSDSMAFSRLDGAEQRALSEGIDTAGGFLVPPDIQAEVLQRTAQSAIFRRLARVVNTSRDRVVFPRVEANTSSGSIYSSGFVGGWAGETPTFTDTDPTFGTFEITIKKARVATKLSNDFIADSATNILSWLAVNGAENMALVEDNAFIIGAGTSLVPLGILNDTGITTVLIENSNSANNISNDSTSIAAGTSSGHRIIDLAYALPAQYTANAVWVVSRNTEGKIRKLGDTSGRFLWPEMSGSALGAAPSSLLGFPLYNSDWVQNDGTDANKVAIFGDLSNYIIAQRAQLSTVVLRERFADNDQTGIILFERVGGGLWNTDAVRIGVV
jgi:HK97 family phage major capsid protein